MNEKARLFGPAPAHIYTGALLIYKERPASRVHDSAQGSGNTSIPQENRHRRTQSRITSKWGPMQVARTHLLHLHGGHREEYFLFWPGYCCFGFGCASCLLSSSSPVLVLARSPGYYMFGYSLVGQPIRVKHGKHGSIPKHDSSCLCVPNGTPFCWALDP